MTTSHLKIATRTSALALWQANHVKRAILEYHPGVDIELIGIKSRGDKILDVSLAKIGGKGLFVKELEQALLQHDADIAVHSIKDVPMELPPGLEMPVICERGIPFDAFVSNRYATLDELPVGAVVGSSSLRRQSQLKARWPHLRVEFLRGNVNTRLAKLDDGQYDAIILAAAGLRRLGLGERIAQELSAEISLPAVGQGALGIECREGDEQVHALIKPLCHLRSYQLVSAERAMNHRLKGGCQVPIAGFAQMKGDKLHLQGLVAEPDGSRVLRAQQVGEAGQYQAIGNKVAQALLSKGADEILHKLLNANGQTA